MLDCTTIQIPRCLHLPSILSQSYTRYRSLLCRTPRYSTLFSYHRPGHFLSLFLTITLVCFRFPTKNCFPFACHNCDRHRYDFVNVLLPKIVRTYNGRIYLWVAVINHRAVCVICIGFVAFFCAEL